MTSTGSKTGAKTKKHANNNHPLSPYPGKSVENFCPTAISLRHGGTQYGSFQPSNSSTDILQYSNHQCIVCKYSTGNSSIKISSHDTNSHNLLHQSSKKEGRKEKRQNAKFKHETKGAVIYSFFFFFLLGRQGREEEDECNCASTSAALGRTDIGIRYRIYWRSMLFSPILFTIPVFLS